MLMVPLDKIIASGLERDEAPDVPEQLARECGVFSRYLAKQKPNNYVLEKYHQCHEKIDFTPADFHDSLLLKLARIRPLFTRMVDVYSRFFRFNSTVRKKLAYLVAILEVTPPYFRFYDSADGGGILGFLVKMGFKGISLVFHLLVSFLFLFPVQVLAKLTKKKSPAPAVESTEEPA